MVGAGGGGQKGEMTSCSQNSLGAGRAVAENRARTNVPVGPHPHQYSQRETETENKLGFSLLWNWFYFRNLTSGRCTKKGAGISSQLVTASGNNTKISLDEWE